MKKATKRIKTFEKYGVETKAMDTLDIKLAIVDPSKNPRHIGKDLSVAQLVQKIHALQAFNSSPTYREYLKKGKELARELGEKRPSNKTALQYMELLDKSDDYIRDEYVYEHISREHLYNIIHDNGGNAMKIKLGQAIRQQGKNVDLSNTLDMLGLSLDDITGQK